MSMADVKLTGWSSNSADFEVSYNRKLAKLALTGIVIPPHLEEEMQEDEALRIEFFRLELVRLAEELQESQSRLSEAYG
jgi:hypothetical protein